MHAQVIISRDDAHAKGLMHFYTGQPCKRGHDSPRYVSTGGCIMCLTRRRPFGPNEVNVVRVPLVMDNMAPLDAPALDWMQPRLVALGRIMMLARDAVAARFDVQRLTHALAHPPGSPDYVPEPLRLNMEAQLIDAEARVRAADAGAPILAALEPFVARP